MTMAVKSALQAQRMRNILDVDSLWVGREWVELRSGVGQYPVHGSLLIPTPMPIVQMSVSFPAGIVE